MAQLGRAALKAFFETGDKPTQSQFADLIDSLLSLIDDSNLADLIKIKSQTDGKIETIISDSFYQITTDGGNFLESFLFLDPSFLSTGFENSFLQIDINNISLVTNGTKSIIFAPDNFTVLQLQRILGLNHANLNVPVFADNASAITGGLNLRDIYQTATGELRIVV